MNDDGARLGAGNRGILHPTDLTPGSEVAFAHALRLSLATRSRMVVLHVDVHPRPISWADFPRVRQTLTRWGLLPPGASSEEVEAACGIRVSKVFERGKDPVTAILHRIEKDPCELLVLALHHHGGVERWRGREVGREVWRRLLKASLFLPEGCGGFVSLDDGSVSIRRVLVPVVAMPDPQLAVDAAARICRALGAGEVAFTVLTVGAEVPRVTLPVEPGWTWRQERSDGGAVERILRAARELPADLVVLATKGRSGFLDALRGSTTEQVLRESPCPVLAVPARDQD